MKKIILAIFVIGIFYLIVNQIINNHNIQNEAQQVIVANNVNKNNVNKNNVNKKLAIYPINSTGFAGEYLSAKHSLHINDDNSAIYYLSNLLQYTPLNEEILSKIISLYVRVGDIDSAYLAVNSLEDIDKNNYLSNVLLFIKHIENIENFTRAEKYLHKISNNYTIRIIKPILFAWLDFGKNGGNSPSEKILALKSENTYLSDLYDYNKAIMYDMIGDHKSARFIYDELTGKNKSVYLRLILADIVNLFKLNKNDEAQQKFIYYSKKFPDILDNISYENIKNKYRTTLPVSNVKQAISETFFDIASILVSNKKIGNEALFNLRLSLALNPDFAQANLLLGDVFTSFGKYSDAVNIYSKIDEKNLIYIRSKISMALALKQNNNNAKALNILHRIEEKYPQNINIKVAIADILTSKKDFIKSAKYYSKALNIIGKKIPYNKWAILYSRGISYEQADNWLKAEADFKQALLLSPNQPDILNYLSYSWLIRGKYLIKAKKYLELAMKKKPNDAYITDSFAWALYLSGDYIKSYKYLEKAINIMPNDVAVNDHLGDVLWRLGRPLEARFQWKRALTFNPKSDEKIKIKYKIINGLNIKEKTI